MFIHKVGALHNRFPITAIVSHRCIVFAGELLFSEARKLSDEKCRAHAGKQQSTEPKWGIPPCSMVLDQRSVRDFTTDNIFSRAKDSSSNLPHSFWIRRPFRKRLKSQLERLRIILAS